MRATLGENVAPEYAPLMRVRKWALSPRSALEPTSSDEKLAQQHVLIVGAGVCAIALGVALEGLGIPYTIGKNDELGGTWYVNRYPGCGVDIAQPFLFVLKPDRGIRGRAISPSARNYSTISRKSRWNTTFESTSD